ncbi:MAG: glycosyltransferase family 4 protein [Flavobacteriaceae bacterium]|nr:glycosyltransferase family 4 protein [Flavobacteriaceae bacterium]
MIIKVIFLLHLPPPVHGASTVGDLIKKRFDLKGNYKKFYRNIGTTKDFKERRKTSFSKIIRFIFDYCINLLFFLSTKPDLVYITCSTYGIGFFKDSLYILLCKVFNTKYLLHFHNKGFHNKKLSKLGRWYHNYILNDSKSILLSRRIEKYYLPFLRNSNCFYLPNGIEDKCPNYKYKAKDNNKILYVSNLVYSKGLLDLLDIAHYLKINNFHFELQIVGNEAEISSEDLSLFIQERGLNDCVYYLGPLYDNDKWKVFQESSLFLYPTHEDCFPLVLLEALCFGLPVICSSEGALEDIVVDGLNGFIIKEYDPVKYGDKIISLFNDKNSFIDFSINSRSRFEKEFTINKFLSNFNSIILSRL